MRRKGIELNVPKISYLMRSRKITGRMIAYSLGVTEVSFSRYMHGTRYPNEDQVEQIAKILGTVAEDIILYGEDGEDPESALNRVRYLCGLYASEWSHNDRISIVDKLMW